MGVEADLDGCFLDRIFFYASSHGLFGADTVRKDTCTQLFNPSIIVFITAAPVATRAFVRKNKVD